MKDNRLIIYGAGIAGVDVLREIQKSPNLKFKVMGFLDDNREKQGEIINGVKVLGGEDELKKISKDIDGVVIAIPSASGERISEIVKLCSDLRLSFRIVPRVKEIIEGRAHIQNIRRVRVEDLLGRPVIKSDVEDLKNFFLGKKVLVTGAAGSIGSELSRQITAYNPKKLILLDWWENGIFELQQELGKSFPGYEIDYVIGNVQDKEKMQQVMRSFKPEYVFHAAAYKHVPLMEDNPEEAVKNTIFGTLNVAELSKENGVEKFVLVSTDKAANPISVMGASKLVAEGIVKNLNGNTKFITVRFGNVLDSYGSVIPLFRKQIERGGPVTVTDKRMTRYFMTIPEAAQLILKAASYGNGGELFVLDMGEPVKIVDLAENLIRLSGFIPQKDIKIIYTGIRKGEKLSENLFNAMESLVRTQKDKIFMSESLGLDLRILPQSLENFRNLILEGDKEGIRKEFARIIESFPKK